MFSVLLVAAMSISQNCQSDNYTTADVEVTTTATVGDVLAISVAASTMGWVNFRVVASNGTTSQAGFSGIAIYKRESAGNVEIVYQEVNGGAEDNIGLTVYADTGNNTIDLVGQAGSSDTTFYVTYWHSSRSI